MSLTFMFDRSSMVHCVVVLHAVAAAGTIVVVVVVVVGLAMVAEMLLSLA